ncbi:AMP-binding protein [Pseudonocardia thermophila]|jgi:Acyl-CoA synthetases (AMP-forming)/AMP-acid ligases II|uniref:AMP-binding protein n=1 Tax=Pseudonocardia thermophila TaxID=1848 RepID=UPI00248DCEFF|nr:AMP-binding protein [Pseudonocardia thermophila]
MTGPFNGPGLGELVVRALRRHPGRLAFVAGDRCVTYAETADLIGRALAAFDARGLRPGDLVLQVVGNRPEQWAVQAACALAGLRSAGLPPGADTAAAAAWCGARLVITEAGLAGFWASTPSAAPLVARADAADVARVAFTRGTTGPRKRVLLSGRALAAAGLFQLTAAEWPAEVRLLCAEPVSGGFGTMVLPALLRGGTVVLTDDTAPETVAEAIDRHRPTVAYLLTVNLARLAHELPVPSTFETLVYSGGPLAPGDLDAALARFGPILVQATGQTEAPKSFAVLGKADHHPGLAATDIGMPLPGMRVAVLGPDGAPVPDGEPGELCLRGPAVMSGYADDPAATAHAFRGGWHHTGDLARLDERGHLHLIGRLG